MDNFNKAKANFKRQEDSYNQYAFKDDNATRLFDEKDDIRTNFFHDADRIIHAHSYTRYANKTQVYSYNKNDNIQMRLIHVQLVSKIARTIGRALGLNIDLIEAISLGHDIGHTPLGHTGEKILNEISQKELGEYFAHNVQGIRNYMYIENNGEGLNLTLEVLDGIFCHNGEMISSKYIPQEKTFDDFLNEYNTSYKNLKLSKTYRPKTLEGCVVRISDIIAYIGRDIEDSINLGKIKREDVPEDIVKILGNTNKEIVNTLVTDIIDNSINKPYIKLSDEVYDALSKLINFNYKNIYNKSLKEEEINYYRIGMNKIYNNCLKDLENNNIESDIYKLFLNNKNDKYKETSNKRIVIDYIDSMTDDYFLNSIKKLEKRK